MMSQKPPTLDEDVLHIITAGTMAPSGDNCQPWRFEVGPGFIDVFNLPERDNSLYSWGQRPSYIANGAVLENMSIAAAQRGYRLSAKVLPTPSDPDWIARAYLERATQAAHPLYESIWKRATNRRPYRNAELTAVQHDALMKTAESGPQLILVTDTARRQELGNLLALNERVLFEDRNMHRFFFSHINWTDEQDAARKLGFSIKTFELPPPVRAGFAVFRHFPALRALNAVGLSSMVAKTNGGIYMTGAAMGAIVIPNRDTTQYVAAGRLFERVWLSVTSMGLHLQPLTGIPLLMNRVADGDRTLAERHASIVADAYARLASVLKLSDGVLAFMFRIGHADEPSARTPRLEPDVRPAGDRSA
ncbi:MAG TPA: hypothetical protein VD862_04535 [Candidatus Paceibacterota bacterium]|nr:hypothetical protein [Candidatus Paceibacterota bacterium]